MMKDKKIKPEKCRCHTPFPEMTPNLDLMYRASRRRVSSTSIGPVTGRANGAQSRSRIHSSTISRTRNRRSRNTSFSESTASRPSSQMQALDYLFDNDYRKFDDNYSLSDDEIKPSEAVINEDRSQRTYRRACKMLNIPQSTAIRNALPAEKELLLRHRALGPADIKAFAMALMVNNKLEVLDFQGNEFGQEGASHISQVITESIFITDLSLSECSLGSEGIAIISEAMKNNETITRLDISGNGLQETDAYYVAELLRNNDNLRELHVGHNFFREKGGQILGPAIGENTSLEILDLCWNHLRNKGAIAICEGVKNNIGIYDLDLSWNGFHLQGSRALAKVLANNFTLKDLDITCNRLDKGCMTEILKGLKVNETLRSLKLGNNPMTVDGAKSIVKTLDQNPSIGLELIDITGQTIDREFTRQLEKLRIRNNIQFIHGPVVSVDDLLRGSGPDTMLDEDPVTVLMEFARLRNLRFADLFPFLDAESEGLLTEAQLRQGLQRARIPVCNQGMESIVNHFMHKEHNIINISDLMAEQLEHKKTLSRLMEGDTPFEETQLGKLSAKLQGLIALRFLHTSKPSRRLAGSGQVTSSFDYSVAKPARQSVNETDVTRHTPENNHVESSITGPVVSEEATPGIVLPQDPVPDAGGTKTDLPSSRMRVKPAKPLTAGVLTRTGQPGFSSRPQIRGSRSNLATDEVFT